MKLNFDKIKLYLELEYPSNEVQDKFLTSNARFKIFRAARRVGKSYTAARDVTPDVLTPNTRGWIVGPTYDLAEKEFRYVLDILLRLHKKFKLPKPTKIRDNPKAGELYLETAWGSEVHGKSADRPMSLVGEENDWIILSEAAQQNSDTWFRYLRPTLSTRLGRAIFPTTPDIAGQWLYNIELDVEEGKLDWGEDAGLDYQKLSGIYSKPWEIFHCAAWDAPHVNRGEIEEARKELSEDAFREQFGGEWTFYTGRVFKQFSRDIHVIDHFQIPKGWRIREGIDYGVRDATVVMWLAESPAGDFYFIDEYYHTSGERPTESHVRVVRGIEAQYTRPSVRVADHHALGRQLCLDWSRNGLPNVDANIDRKTRRDRFMAYLELRDGRHPFHVREAGLPPGRYPRLFVFKTKCPNLIREMLLLKWKDSAMKEGNFGDTVGDDHAIDAGEYVIWYATKGIGGHGMRRSHVIRKPSSVLTGY